MSSETTGTRTSPASIQKAPALMGERSRAGKLAWKKILAVITTVENRKLVQQAARVAFFQYRPYRKGARKAPASAPQLTPISWAIKVTLE